MTAEDPGGGDGPTGFTDPDRHAVGDAYWYRIQARVVDAGGRRPSPGEEGSAWVQATVHAAPSALSGNSYGEGDAIVLTWNPPADDGGSAVTGYDVRYRLSGTTRWTTLTGVEHNPVPGGSSRKFAVSGLTRGKFYDAEVRAVAALPGPWSRLSGDSLNTHIRVSIAAHTTPVGEEDDVAFVITVTPVADYVLDVSGSVTVNDPAYDHLAGNFNVRVPIRTNQVTLTRTGAQDSVEAPDGQVTATLSDGTTYDLGSPASAVVAVTNDDQLAGAPGTPTATPGQHRVALSWTAPTAPGQTDGAANTITDYRLQWADNMALTDATSADVAVATSHTVTGLRSATAYWFRVCAVSPGGCGAWSSSVKATTPTSPPTAPAGLTTATGDRSVALTWSAPADAGGSAITAYDVRHRTAGATAWTETTDAWETGDGALAYRVPNLVNGADYEFSVRAHNADHGAGDWLAPPVTARPTTPVVGVVWFRAAEVTEGTGAAFLFRASPAPAADISVAYHASGGGGFTQDDYTAGRDLSVIIPAGETSKQVVVATVDDEVDEPDAGITVMLKTPAGGSGYVLGTHNTTQVNIVDNDSLPAAPTIATLTGSLSAATLTVTWTAPTDDGGNPITSYEVRHEANVSGGWTKITGIAANGTSHTFAPADLGPASPQVQVRAVTATGPSAWSGSRQETFCTGNIVFKDCRILLQARDTLTGTTGGGLNWSATRNVNQWTGVQVNSAHRADVVRLQGSDHNTIRLRGSIPPTLGRLDALRVLDLTGYRDRRLPADERENAYLIGTIPVELANLSNLTLLDLATNNLTGRIPTELGSLSELVTLLLNGNKLTGGIPEELGNLRKLQILSLSNNPGLGGAIPPELGNISTLSSLNIERAALTGALPPELGDLESLNSLVLSDNNLTGSIPTEYGMLTAMVNLRLNENDLTGDIPHSLGAMTMLRQLYIAGGNRLTGCLPAAWYTVPAVAQSSQPRVGNDVESAGLLYCAPVDVQTRLSGDRRVKLSWKSPRTASTLGRIFLYQVRYVRGSGDISAATTSTHLSTSTFISGLTAGDEHRFQVRYSIYPALSVVVAVGGSPSYAHGCCCRPDHHRGHTRPSPALHHLDASRRHRRPSDHGLDHDGVLSLPYVPLRRACPLGHRHGVDQRSRVPDLLVRPKPRPPLRCLRPRHRHANDPAEGTAGAHHYPGHRPPPSRGGALDAVTRGLRPANQRLRRPAPAAGRQRPLDGRGPGNRRGRPPVPGGWTDQR